MSGCSTCVQCLSCSALHVVHCIRLTGACFGLSIFECSEIVCLGANYASTH